MISINERATSNLDKEIEVTRIGGNADLPISPPMSQTASPNSQGRGDQFGTALYEKKVRMKKQLSSTPGKILEGK